VIGVELLAHEATAVFLKLLAAGVLDEDAAHGPGGEEVVSAVLGRCFLLADQAQVGLVNQGGGLKRLSRRPEAQLLCGERAQLVVDQRQKLAGVLRVALRDSGPDARGTATTTRTSTSPWSLPVPITTSS
jgi:hypothetical protein